MLNRVLCVMWHRSTQGQTRRALRGCWFSIGFTRYSLHIGPRPTGGCSSRAIAAVTPLYVFCLFSNGFRRFPVNRVRIRCLVFPCQAKKGSPLENVGFPLVLQGMPYRFASAPLGGQQQDRFPSGATLGDLLHFPMVFMISGQPCSDLLF